MSALLSTAAAARAAGVGLTTVKRWADSGLIRCVKTAGGHRRFVRDELERFLRAHGATGEEHAQIDWIDLLLAGRPYEVEGHLLQARGRLGAWYRVADSLGPVLDELGRLWRDGRISVLDEHLASERLARALERVSEGLPIARDAPRCLLACAEEDEHTLGLSLAEVCLREAGWLPLWAGRRAPTRELVRRIGAADLRMVALSASAASQDARALAHQVAQVMKPCGAAGIELVLGGCGAWPESPRYGTRMHRFDAFHELLAGLR